MNPQLVDDALLAMLRAQVDGDGNPLSIGDAQAPQPPEGAVGPAMPYAALYPFDGGEVSGESLGNPHTHVELVYQVLSVGYSRQSARWMADRIRQAIVGRNASGYVNTITPAAGAACGVARRRHLSFGNARREGTIWNVSDEFSFLLVPT